MSDGKLIAGLCLKVALCAEDVSALSSYTEKIRADGFQAGAASRDAEIQRLQFALADAEALELGTAERCDQLRAQINRLLDAVKVIETDSEEVLDFDEWTAMCVPMDSYHDLVDAAEATPEQSLAAYRNKVIEDCAKQCAAPNEYGFHRTGYESAEAIRAMKEQP